MFLSRHPGRLLRQAAVCAAVVLGAAAVLTACGGGTSQFESFTPSRIIVFGDETSLVTSSGNKSSINGTTSTDNGDGTTTDTIDCTLLQNFAQAFAGAYGYSFAECNTNPSVDPRGIMRAADGARVADIAVQIDAQIANGGFGNDDLATVLAGSNDVLDLYAQFPARGEDELADEAGERGRDLARQVNRLVDFGAKVIVVTIPDLGVTPFANKQKLQFDDTDRAALLKRLTQSFNEQLGANILLDGRFVGLVQGDVRSEALVRSPGSFGVANATDAACVDTVPLLECTDKTLVENASATNWLWSDDTHLAYIGQQQLAGLALDRARRNPF